MSSVVFVLAAFSAEAFENWARQVAEYFPEAVRQQVTLTLVTVILVVACARQLWQSFRLVGSLAGHKFWRRLVVWSHVAIGVLLAMFTVLVWSMPGSDLRVQAARIIVPYESLTLFCVGIIGLLWMFRDWRIMRAARAIEKRK